MRKRLFPALLVLLLCLAPAVQAASAAEAQLSAERVYNAMIALKGQYPEGTPWTNDNYYGWKGGIYSGGYGCAGFAFMLSDAAFGDLPARKLTSFAYSDVRVGDILRMGNDTHSVIVLEVNDSRVIVAEGNFNSSTHWGRPISQREVMESDYLMTRYPETQPEPQPKKDLALANNQDIEFDGVKVPFQTYMLLDDNGYGTNYVKLRDVAHVLNGTDAQFAVGYSSQTGISVSTGSPYADNGSEMTTPFAGADKEYARSDMALTVNGSPIQLDTITLLDANGGGYNYFKLRDLGAALGFRVDWSADRGVFVETK